MSRKNLKKEYENYTLKQLRIERNQIEHIIDSCQDYLQNAYNTFLGPFAAAQTIKINCKKLEILNSLINEKETKEAIKEQP